MRVILMHNPTAGTEDHTIEELVRRVERAGHEVTRAVTRRRDLHDALRKRCDAVVLAGGDGTVRLAARALGATGVPFIVLPLGTANNIARRLGVPLDLDDSIASWERSALRGFDRAHVQRDGDSTTFIEALGFGVFPEVLREEASRRPPDGREDALERDLDLFRRTLEEATPIPYTVWSSGEDLSGEYLLVEVMNTGLIGPNLTLAPRAHPGDGSLDLVLVGEAERPALVDYLTRLRKRPGAAAHLPVIRTGHVVISTSGRRYHQDGVLLPRRPKGHLHIEVIVEPHALQVRSPGPR